MSKFAIDAYALIEYLEGSSEGLKVKEIVENTDNEIYTSTVTLAEVISKFLRMKKDENVVKDALQSLSKITTVDKEMGVNAGKIHAEIRKKVKDFELADAFVMVMADRFGLKIVTKDPHFKYYKNVLFI